MQHSLRKQWPTIVLVNLRAGTLHNKLIDAWTFYHVWLGIYDTDPVNVVFGAKAPNPFSYRVRNIIIDIVTTTVFLNHYLNHYFSLQLVTKIEMIITSIDLGNGLASGGKPVRVLMMAYLLRHIWATRPRWVKLVAYQSAFLDDNELVCQERKHELNGYPLFWQ